MNYAKLLALSVILLTLELTGAALSHPVECFVKPVLLILGGLNDYD